MYTMYDSICVDDADTAYSLRFALSFMSGTPLYIHRGYDEEMNVEFWITPDKY